MECPYPADPPHARFAPAPPWWGPAPHPPLHVSAPLARLRRLYSGRYRPPPLYRWGVPPHHVYGADVYGAYVPSFYPDALNPHSAA